MKNQQILLIIGIIMVIIFLGKSSSLQAIISPPSVDYSFNFDEDASLSEKQPLFIGSDLFEINPVVFTCKMIQHISAPKPSSSCWITSVDFQGETINFVYGDEKPINDFLKVKWTTDSRIHRPTEKKPFYYFEPGKSYYTFSIYNDDFLEAKVIEKSTLIELNSQEKIEIEVRQELANNMPGGIIIYETHQLSNNIPIIKTIPMTFKKGINKYSLDLDTSMLGRMDIKIRPYVTILNKEFHDDRTSPITYNILPKIEDVDTSIDCTSKQCPSGFVCEKMTYENNEYNLCIKGNAPPSYYFQEEQKNYGIMAVILLLFALIIVIGLRKNKNRR